MFEIFLCCCFSILVINSIFIILVQNLFFAILFLVINYLVATVALVALELEFLAYIFSIIYIGALAVLLIFVLLLLDIKSKYFFKSFFLSFPIGISLSIVFFLEIVYLVFKYFNVNSYNYVSKLFYEYSSWYSKKENINDLEIISTVLYSEFVVQFLIVGLILFLSLIGAAILIVIEVKTHIKMQKPSHQLARKFNTAVYRIKKKLII